MNALVTIDRRPGLGARTTIGLLRALRSKQPLDGSDPAAILRARAKIDGFDAFTARFQRKASLPYGVANDRIGDVPVLDLTVRDVVAHIPGAVLLFVHGGGFFFRSIHGHMLLAARIAQGAGIARVVMPLYRLAPEHVFPAAQEDCLHVYRDLLAGGVDPARIVIAADSAGAALAMGMLIRARTMRLAMPRALALMSPMLDLSLSGASIAENADRDPMLGGVPMPVPTYYLGNADAADPACSPLFAELAGLPPMLVQVGSTERLLDDSRRLLDAAGPGGVRVDVEIWREMPHVFQACQSASKKDPLSACKRDPLRRAA